MFARIPPGCCPPKGHRDFTVKAWEGGKEVTVFPSPLVCFGIPVFCTEFIWLSIFPVHFVVSSLEHVFLMDPWQVLLRCGEGGVLKIKTTTKTAKNSYQERREMCLIVIFFRIADGKLSVFRDYR